MTIGALWEVLNPLAILITVTQASKRAKLPGLIRSICSIVTATTVISSLPRNEKFFSNIFVRRWARPISIDISFVLINKVTTKKIYGDRDNLFFVVLFCVFVEDPPAACAMEAKVLSCYKKC